MIFDVSSVKCQMSVGMDTEMCRDGTGMAWPTVGHTIVHEEDYGMLDSIGTFVVERGRRGCFELELVGVLTYVCMH